MDCSLYGTPEATSISSIGTLPKDSINPGVEWYLPIATVSNN